MKQRVNEIFDRFSIALSAEEVQLAKAKLENGQEIETEGESFSEGADVFVTNDEGERIPLPSGEYTMADGSKIIVEDGKIGAQQEEEEMSAEVKEEVKEETPEQELEAEAPLTAESVKQMISEAIAPLTKAIEMASQEMEKFSKMEAENPLPRVKKTPKKVAPVDLTKLSLTERVNAIHEQFSL